MPRKNPLGRIKDTALGTIKDPVGAAGKAVGQARGTVALGRLVADQVTKSASGAVVSRLPGHRTAPKPKSTEAPASTPTAPAAKQAPPKKAPSAKAATSAPARKAATARASEPSSTDTGQG